MSRPEYYVYCNAWDLFDTDGVLEIQKDDEAGMFSSDLEAIKHVGCCMFCQQALGNKLLSASPDGRWSVP